MDQEFSDFCFHEDYYRFTLYSIEVDLNHKCGEVPNAWEEILFFRIDNGLVDLRWNCLVLGKFDFISFWPISSAQTAMGKIFMSCIGFCGWLGVQNWAAWNIWWVWGVEYHAGIFTFPMLQMGVPKSLVMTMVTRWSLRHCAWLFGWSGRNIIVLLMEWRTKMWVLPAWRFSFLWQSSV
jgi:hypothetical protein